MDLSGPQGELPLPMSASYISSSHGGVILHGHDRGASPPTPPSNGPAQPRPPSSPPMGHADDMLTSSRKRGVPAAHYRECLKNHAASIGGNATDGCGEFMPSGEGGTLEALRCSACGCHRNFHRKEVEGEFGSSYDCSILKGRRAIGPMAALGPMAHKGGGLLVDPFGFSPRAPPQLLPPPPATASSLHHHAHHHMVMPLSVMQTSDQSDEMEVVGGGSVQHPPPGIKKRFRTKFTPEQKEKMLGFAERVGWRLQKLEDGVVQQFCQEVGVKRRVLKVWMHNNKHNLAAKKMMPLPTNTTSNNINNNTTLQLE